MPMPQTKGQLRDSIWDALVDGPKTSFELAKAAGQERNLALVLDELEDMQRVGLVSSERGFPRRWRWTGGWDFAA